MSICGRTNEEGCRTFLTERDLTVAEVSYKVGINDLFISVNVLKRSLEYLLRLTRKGREVKRSIYLP